MICVIDYGSGNLNSIKNAVDRLNFQCEVSCNPKIISKSDKIILPGVGAFSAAIEKLKKNKLDTILSEEVLNKKKPILGICLGMQLLLSKSYEMGEHSGLDIIKGKNVLIKTDIKNIKFKIPHIDWEEVRLCNNAVSKNSILNSLNGKSFYFVHSYMASLENLNNIIAQCQYHDVKIPAIIQSNNIIGCQFHPEKSGINGLKLLKNAFKML